VGKRKEKEAKQAGALKKKLGMGKDFPPKSLLVNYAQK
jgi:hypothetical protein